MDHLESVGAQEGGQHTSPLLRLTGQEGKTPASASEDCPHKEVATAPWVEAGPGAGPVVSCRFTKASASQPAKPVLAASVGIHGSVSYADNLK